RNGVTGASGGNYTASLSTAGNTLAITQKALTATIANQSKTYGADDPSLAGITPALAGVINRTVSTWNGNVVVNDTNNVSASVASLTRNAGENVGSYNITAGTFPLAGSSAGNYSGASFTYSPTFAPNLPSLPTRRATDLKTYGADDPSLAGITPALAGVINRTVSTWNGNVVVNDTNNVSAS